MSPFKTLTILFGSLIIISSLAACKERKPDPIPKYHHGDFVQSVVSGQTGQVIRTLCWNGFKHCRYNVRFATLQILTNTHTFGSDGPVDILPLTIIKHMREYELRPGSPPK